ncbi:MAG TPA: hypothetical protein VIJ92_13225 [Ginsengibacter sp.]
MKKILLLTAGALFIACSSFALQRQHKHHRHYIHHKHHKQIIKHDHKHR